MLFQGDRLICPAHGFMLGHAAPAGRLDGLMCYSASSSELITDATPMANITSMVYIEHHGMSSGAVAGIVILVLVLVAGMAGAPLRKSHHMQCYSHAERIACTDASSSAMTMAGMYPLKCLCALAFACFWST